MTVFLTEDERAIVKVTRDFVDRAVTPTVRQLDHDNIYPSELIEQMKAFGMFGLVIPKPWGESGSSTRALVAITEELCRGWMSLGGAIGGHSVICSLIVAFGTDDQRERFLPKLATGEYRAAMALTEPGGGSDLQNNRTRAVLDGDHFVVNGTKTWITNAAHAQVIGLLCKTDQAVTPAHRGFSMLLVEPSPGMTVSQGLGKLGYKGVESCEVNLENCQVPVENLLGGVEGRGFAQIMRGLELGRIQVAARALGVARAAFELSLAYAQDRSAFGVPIWKHQSISNYLADMAVKLEAARLMVYSAAERHDAGDRCDLQAAMAKLYASEVCMELSQTAVRIHASNGYSTEYHVERLYRDAPLMVVGEGTNEIQRNVITNRLIQLGGLGN